MELKKYYKNFWIASINITSKNINEFVNTSKFPKNSGVWVNVIIKSSSMFKALRILKSIAGIKDFEINMVENIINMNEVIEYDDFDYESEIISQVDSLFKSKEHFIIILGSSLK